MTTQLNIRVSEEFLEQAKHYAKVHGFLNIQEFLREAAREKIFEGNLIRNEYLEILSSKEANTFLSGSESKDFEKELKKRAKLK